YELALRMIVTRQLSGGSSASRRLLATASVAVTLDPQTVLVKLSPLVVTLPGGDRPRSIDREILLDASNSYDPDQQTLTGSGSVAPMPENPVLAHGLSVTWLCLRTFADGGTMPCLELGTTVLTQARLVIAPYTLGAGRTYRFTCVVNHAPTGR